MSKNLMTISVQKCAVISFHRCSNPMKATYTIGRTPLARVNEINDLGVLLDDKLTFGPHRANIIDRASRQLGFLMKVSKDFTNIHCLISLYSALVRSIVESSAIVWAPYQTTWIDRIERLQKRFVRFALRRLSWTDS